MRGTSSMSAVMLASLAMLALACGGSPSSTPTPSAEAAPSSSATATPSATPPPWPVAAVLTPVARAHITTDNLNVRTGPSTTAPAIGLLQPGDDIEVAGRSADSQWLAIPEVGWTAYRAEWMQLSGDLKSLPAIEARALVPAMQPTGASSGYPLIDAIVDAVLSQDVARLRQQIQTMSLPCQRAPGMGGPPPCSLRPGADPNTNLEVFPTSVCEGEHVLADSLPTILPRLYLSDATPGVTNVPLRLYAVIAAPREQSAYFPDGRWVAIFAQPDGSGRALGITEKGIVRIDFGCRAQATEMLQRRQFEAPQFVLSPVLKPPVRPRP
ncbi:MAG: SH3 domain-containing protein [Dehalococcoidia bacterium]